MIVTWVNDNMIIGLLLTMKNLVYALQITVTEFAGKYKYMYIQTNMHNAHASVVQYWWHSWDLAAVLFYIVYISIDLLCIYYSLTLNICK